MSTVFRLTNGRGGPPPEFAGPPVARIFLVASEVRDDSTGQSILRLARELRRRGKEVDLACGGGALVAEFERLGIRPLVSRHLLAPGKPLLTPRALVSRVREFNPDLLHFFGRPLAGWASRLSRITRRPYALTVMTFASPSLRDEVRGDWRRGAVLAACQELREELVNEDRVPKEAIAVIPIGVALEDYERYRDAGGPRTVPVVGTVGPLTPERGCEYFVRAAREILDRGCEAHFLIAGDGSEDLALRRLIRKLELDKQVTMAESFTDYRRMIAVLDVCVIPAIQEGLTLNVIEAMACRKPVVATGVGPVCSVISDGETGFLAPKKDPSAIADKAIQLLSDRDLAQRIVERAYEMVRERFSMDLTVQNLLSFYSQCLARAKGA